jgi:hypothetical protein
MVGKGPSIHGERGGRAESSAGPPNTASYFLPFSLLFAAPTRAPAGLDVADAPDSSQVVKIQRTGCRRCAVDRKGGTSGWEGVPLEFWK